MYNTYKITGLPDGKNSSDAINKKQLDNEVTEINDKIIALEAQNEGLRAALEQTESLRASLDQIVKLNE